MGLGSALPEGTAVRTAETGWSPSAQAAAAGGAGRGGSPAVLGAQLRGPGLGQTGPQGGNLCFLYSARLPGLQVPAVAGGGSGVWGRASGRCPGREGVEGVVLFTGWRGGEGAKTETRESRTDLKGKDAFPCAITSPQVSTGIVSLRVEWLFVCFYGRCFVTTGEIPFSKCA